MLKKTKSFVVLCRIPQLAGEHRIYDLLVARHVGTGDISIAQVDPDAEASADVFNSSASSIRLRKKELPQIIGSLIYNG